MTKKDIKFLRLYHGMTQQQFAAYIEVGESTIAKVEAGFAAVTDFIQSRVYRKFDLLDEGFMTFCQRMNGGK